MRNWSCKSLYDKKNKYKQKIDFISNRMVNLEKDIEEIKMKNLSPIQSSKNIRKVNIINDNIIKDENNKNNNKNKKRNYNLYFNYSTKSKFLIYNNLNYNKREINKSSFISKEKLEYEYKLRILKRKIQKLKLKNKELNENLNMIKEKNNKLEYSLNIYNKNTENDIPLNRNKDDISLKEINIINKKNSLIEKIMIICKKNNNYYNSYENSKNEEERIFMNMFLNIMDIKYLYENSILYNSFLNGLKFLFPNFKNIKDLLDYINKLMEEENKLKIINNEYENMREYYNLCKQFSSIKQFDNFLNKIIKNNKKDEKIINKIKNVLKEEKMLNNSNYNGMNETNRKKLLNQFLNKSRNYSNYDKLSFYTANYYNNDKNNKNYKNKLIHHNINNILKEDNKQQENNSCNDIKIIRKKINSNLNNYIKNKRCINKISKSYSRTVNNRQQKNFNKLYSYSVSNNS